MIYIIILLCSALLAMGLDRLKISDGYYCLFIWLLFLLLFVPSAIRFGIGIDYDIIYIPLILDVQDGIDGVNCEGVEASFFYIVHLCQQINPSPQLVIAFYAFFTYLFAILSFGRERLPIGGLAVVLLQYIPSYNIMRQSLAISCLMLAYRFFSEKKYWAMILMSLLAGAIHSSAVIFLPIVLLACVLVKVKNKFLVISFAVGLLISFFANPVGIIMRAMEHMPKYGTYLSSDLFMEPAHLSSGIGEALYLIVDSSLLIGLLYANRGTVITRITAILCGIAAITEVIGLHLEIFMRVTYITNFILPFAVAELYLRSEDCIRNKMICHFCLGIWGIIFIRGIAVGYLGGESPHGVVPYKSVLSAGEIINGEY